MSAIDSVFDRLRSSGHKAFIPFITAGDPHLAFTADVLRELSARGSAICELGIPYSDPIADGPVIQASYTRALENKIKLSDIFAKTRDVGPELTAPIVTMVSYAIVYRYGLQRYVEQAKASGIEGAIVPDLLVDESTELAAICRKADFSLIQLVTPTTPRARAVRIAQTSTGFLYFVSVTGITGERDELPPELTENVAWLREQTNLPVCVGFGISKPEHVRKLSPVADGFIVGSALVARIAQVDANSGNNILSDVGDYVAKLIAAME